jgi:integrase
MALTDVRIRNAKPRQERYRLADSHGLSIEISPSGGKYWRYRYRIAGKENLFAAGEWCQAPAGESEDAAVERRASGGMTLAEARAARVVWRGLVRIGQHPRLARQAARLAAVRTQANTFQALADEFVEKRGRKWTKPHRNRFRRFMTRDVVPHIGNLPISTITAAQVLAVLRMVEDRGTIQAANLGRGFIGAVFRYAVATQKATIDPVPSLRGALATAERKHHQPLDRADIKPFLVAVSAARANRATEIAIWLLLLTMTRTVELRAAPWAEFDLQRAEWRIPPARMKMRRPHVVPLSNQAVSLLRELRSYSGQRPLLFPNERDPWKPMGASTLVRVFERAGYGGRFSPHSFRGTAATLLREAGFDSRLIELQLAHVDRNKSRASYDHAELLEPRRKMLQAWADMIDAAALVSPRVLR